VAISSSSLLCIFNFYIVEMFYSHLAFWSSFWWIDRFPYCEIYMPMIIFFHLSLLNLTPVSQKVIKLLLFLLCCKTSCIKDWISLHLECPITLVNSTVCLAQPFFSDGTRSFKKKNVSKKNKWQTKIVLWLLLPLFSN